MSEVMTTAGDALEDVKIETIPFGSTPDEFRAAVDRGGAVIMENVLSREQIDQINADFDPYFAGRAMGTVDNRDPRWKEFYGEKTRRVMSAVSVSETYRNAFLENDTIWNYARAMVREVADEVRVSNDGVFEIHPGEKEQMLHRDGGLVKYFANLGPTGPNIICNMMIALTDITEEMGATRIIPGSHKWDFDRPFDQSMTVPVEVKAGSVYTINGGVVHGGGANRSTKIRRVLSAGLHPAWIMPEHAFVWSVSKELANSFSPRLRRATCYGTVDGVWKFNFDDLDHFMQFDDYELKN